MITHFVKKLDTASLHSINSYTHHKHKNATENQGVKINNNNNNRCNITNLETCQKMNNKDEHDKLSAVTPE